MNLKNQIVSLELAKKLKELGMKQESLWYWFRRFDLDKKNEGFIWHYDELDLEAIQNNEAEIFSAYTPAELGEMLPTNIKGYFLTIIKMGIKEDYWSVRYMENLQNKEVKQWHWRQLDDNLANVLAKMIIYLKENKLI